MLRSQDEVQRVVDRFRANSLERNQQPDKIRDYVVQPQESGYRAVSTSIRGSTAGESRCRSAPASKDSWAKIVEDLTSSTGIDFKSGDGPDEVHDLLRRLSELLSQRIPGQPPTDQPLLDILTRLAMMIAVGHMIQSFDQGTGED